MTPAIVSILALSKGQVDQGHQGPFVSPAVVENLSTKWIKTCEGLEQCETLSYVKDYPGGKQISMPYTAKLTETLGAGETIDIQGRIDSDAERWITQTSTGGISIDQQYRDGGEVNEEWGKEEHESSPYKPGEVYSLKIRVLEEGFEIWCDEKKAHLYKHRMDYDAIEYLQIKGDCTLSAVQWGGRFYDIPLETTFHDAFLAGHSILMHVIPEGDEWNLDLLRKDGDVLFHFNPRFKEKQIVRNSYIDGEWGDEEREGKFPFVKGRGYNLKFENEANAILIFVNNELFGTFEHRTPYPTTDYTGMRVEGEVDVTKVVLD